MSAALPRQRAPRRVTAAALLAAALIAGVAAVLAAGGSGAPGAAGAGATAGSGELLLEVFDHEHGRAVHGQRMRTGDQFTLTHTHSVTRRPVRETFSVSASGVAMEELWFDEFGANLPAGPEEVDGSRTTFVHEDGAYRVRHHGRLLPTVPLRVGSPQVDHVLTFADGTVLRLLDLVRPAAFVELRVVAS